VATFPASGGHSFAIGPGTCVAGQCPAVVHLLDDGKTIDSAPLDFAASDAKLNKAAADESVGARDPLQQGDPLPAWTAGDGEGTVVTVGRSVRLSSDRLALLVDQAGGFEHVKRRHYLFVADGQATVSKTDLAKALTAKTKKLVKESEIKVQQITEIQKALKADFEAADTNWVKWTKVP
jgi:hypothetical protein